MTRLRRSRPALAGLTEDHQDEHCVDEVVGSGHGLMIRRRPRFVVGRQVERWVEPASTHGLTPSDQTPERATPLMRS